MNTSRIARFLVMMIALLVSQPAFCGEVRLLRIGTGGLLGVYHPIGKALAEAVTAASVAPGLIAVAQTSGGSVANVKALAAGEIEAGLVQADSAHRALNGEGPFASVEGASEIRAVAGLYPERLQIVTRRDAGISSVADFRGKSVSLDENGSGTLAVMRIVLAVYGLTEEDFQPVYLKPEFTRERLAQGKLQGFCLMAGTPTKAIQDIFGDNHALVPVSTDIAREIGRSHPYLAPGLIPAGTYPGVTETPSIEVRALLVVRADMDEDLVHDITAAIWQEQSLATLRSAHSQGNFITPGTALKGLSIPLHEGARRYYEQQGLLTGDVAP
jgi:hypothetical protein